MLLWPYFIISCADSGFYQFFLSVKVFAYDFVL